ncbi:MAG: succinate dehydrogenase cytochrome b subunit [Cyclobacteriaceae bacterium]|nr:succinate dehydrogenase cytochrome b subunit [Cyclobacteriaceae bacterium]
MKWFLALFSSTLGRKVVMALTGLFLISFLVVHLIGNLQLLKDDGGHAFNVYADFMGHNPIIQTIAKGNFAFILIHIFWSLMLTIKNRKARGKGYDVPGKSSAWSSRNMGILGTIILVFLVIHLQHFWAQMHFGQMPVVNYDGKEVKDIYTLVNHWFHVPWYVTVYVFSMAAVAFHLVHGFQSAFQTLGLNHLKYNPIIKFVGYAYALIVPALFALIPVYMFFN